MRSSIFIFFFLIFAFNQAFSASIDFSKDVRPILAKHCFACHGPDDKHREADLRLDTEAGAKKVEDGFSALVPGKPQESEMYRRMITEDQDDLMPPPEHGKFMKPEEIKMVKRWIEAGAPWGNHWAYEKPVRPEGLTNTRHPIDQMVEAKASQKGLQLNTKADKRTLIRRVSLDLRGLPPTQEEIQSFLEDNSKNAYANMIDRFLSDPAYGEKWALHWLDLARYADSQGYEKDRGRTVWRYRDWVINAFNNDMSFDQFTREQLAGDLLEQPTHDQILATAFHRNTMTNTEGGTDDEEFRVLAVKDRVDTTGLVWMGLSVGCAKCHTHKYDPITIDEYYQLYGIFNQTADRDLGNDFPVVASPTSVQKQKMDQLNPELKDLKKEFEKARSGFIKSEAFQAYYDSELKKLEQQKEIKSKELEQLVRKEASKRSKKEQQRLKSLIAQTHLSVKPYHDEVNKLNDRIKAVGVPNIPIMKELQGDQRRVTKLHERGNFLAQGKVLKANFPKAFHAFDEEPEKSRLDLANWLMSKENPLTARVHTNRIWSILFGQGIVETLGDFGSQGAFPSHPRLLDWLAIEFMENGWSTKKFLKAVMLSDTYQRDSKATSRQIQLDPKNTYLARGPRVRLDAEMIRDQALSVAGLLSKKMYGPPVMPPQPEGIWSSVYNSGKWETSQGEDRYRRGLYTYIKRTAPYPSMMIFDGTSRENCSVQRLTTNTPLQAFVTLNDPVYVEITLEIGRQASERMDQESPEQLIVDIFEKTTSRLPLERETKTLLSLYHQAKQHFGKHPEKLSTYLKSFELGKKSENSELEWGSWAVVASAILNLDECFMKG